MIGAPILAAEPDAAKSEGDTAQESVEPSQTATPALSESQFATASDTDTTDRFAQDWEEVENDIKLVQAQLF